MDYLGYVLRIERSICVGCVARRCADKHIASDALATGSEQLNNDAILMK
jgi:hypothetical protein